MLIQKQSKLKIFGAAMILALILVCGTAAFAATTASPSSLKFSGQTVGTTSAPMTVTLENDQPGAMGIAQIVTSGDFAIDPSTTCPSNGRMIKSGKSCTIAVTFAPSATGARTGSLVVHGGTAIDPVTVSLSGNGT